MNSFLITKLSKNSQVFVSSFTSIGTSRSLEVSIALARVLVQDASVPSEPVEDIQAHFRVQGLDYFNKMLDKINSFMSLDLNTVYDMALRFYSVRYNMAHYGRRVAAFNKETALEDFFEISRSFDKSTIDFIRNNSTKLATLVNEFCGLVQDLRDKESEA